MNSLTAVILTNDKKRAEKARASVKFADEVLLVEAGEIDNFALARNSALKKAKSTWVLFVDDDEEVTSGLAKEIKQAIQRDDVDGYYINRLDTFLGRELKHGETAAVKLLRLARRSKGQFHRPVHEVWYIEGRKSSLKSPLLHTPHASIAEFLDKINRYSTIEARYRHGKGIKSSLFKIAVYPAGKCIRNYVLKKGFLDGTPGAIMAIMMSFHSFQTWTKLYLLQHKR